MADGPVIGTGLKLITDGDADCCIYELSWLLIASAEVGGTDGETVDIFDDFQVFTSSYTHSHTNRMFVLFLFLLLFYLSFCYKKDRAQ